MRAIRHPLLRLSRTKRLVTFLASVVLTFVLLTAIRTLDANLQTPAARWGMLSLQFARTAERSTEVIKSWDIPAEKSASSSLLLNFLFPLCYSTLFSIACFAAAGMFHERGFRKTGWLSTAIGWIQWPAAVVDLVENVALWVQLNGSIAQPWPQIAYFCALIKFVAIAAAVCVLIAALLIWILRRRAAVVLPP